MDLPITIIRPYHIDEEVPAIQQGFLSHCIDAILLARQHLSLSASNPTAYDNALTTHLGQVLMVGLHPDQAKLWQVVHAPQSVYEELRRADGRHQRYRVALDTARTSLFLHGLHLVGPNESPITYERLSYISRACYRCAAGLMPDNDLETVVFRTISITFPECSQVLGQAAVEMNFVEAIPPGLIS